MTITLDALAYGSTAEVADYCRYLLQGEQNFSASTRPTLTAVVRMINRTSSVLNVAFARFGFQPADVYANAIAKGMCDDWVVAEVARRVELTQPGAGYNDQQSRGSRTRGFADLHKDAVEFVKEISLGLNELGIASSRPVSAGLVLTSYKKASLRRWPKNDDVEQPAFTRGQFDNKRIGNSEGDDCGL